MAHVFWSWQLCAALVLNGVVQALSIAAYAARLAGALSGRAATAMSLFNIFVTSSRFASMAYTPVLGSLSDRAHGAGIPSFEWQLRAIVFAGFIGAVVGTIAIPAFVALYLRAIVSLERNGSVPRALRALISWRTLTSVASDMKRAFGTRNGALSFKGVPKDVLVLNAFVTAIYGVGIVAAAYASVLYPAAARTALLSSGLVNGFATIAYNIVVDPASALMTDRAARGDCSVGQVRALVVGLAATAMIGFLLSQLLLVPAAWAIGIAAGAINGH
jgi:Alternate to MurJ